MSTGASSPAGLQVDDLHVEVQRRPLLRELSFHVRPGEAWAIGGRSGCGKTTLLRCLARLHEPSRGTITLDGCRAEELGFPTYRRRVVYVAQRAVMLPGALERNLAFAYALATADGPYPQAEAERLLARFNLGALDRQVEAARLSEGERQRVGLIRALLLSPAVLLLDEPTSGLDPATVMDVEEELRERVTRGMALLLVSHDPAQVDRLVQHRLNLEAHRV